MDSLRIPTVAAVSALLVATFATISTARAQDQAAIRKTLESRYALTQPTAANNDIVTAGSVLTLKVNKITMFPVSITNFCKNSYQDGKISHDAACKMAKASKALKQGGSIFGKILPIPTPTTPDGPEPRDFVKGEKMWVTGIEVRSDSVVFTLFTDAFNDVRYKTWLTFPTKGAAMTADTAIRLVGEVFDAPAPEIADNSKPPQPPGSPRQSAEGVAPPAVRSIPDPPVVVPPPPPPPTDAPAPPTFSLLGQTTDQVVANLGKPEKVDRQGNTQVYHYPGLTVTFVGGKVTDAQ
jgi:hypothetical protein